MRKIILLAILSFVWISQMDAQKFGYVNSQELLAGMPEIKTADTELKTYQEKLVEKGQSMLKTFEEEYKKYMEESQKGLLSQVQSQEREAALTAKQQEIQSYEIEVQDKLQLKREELYKPILDKVKNAIETYGKENSYTMIFDASAGAILHALESDNLLEPIKLKLGQG